MAPVPAITFAIPYFRDPRLLAAAVASVRAQTVEDWELVVVDDAGPHGEAGAAVVAGLADRRARYVRHDRNLGLAGNWNRCLDAAGAPVVTLLHADDELAPRYAELVLAAHARHPQAAATFCRAEIVDGDGRPLRSLPDAVKRVVQPRRSGDLVVEGDAGLASLMRGQYVFCPTLAYRRAALGSLRFDGTWRMVLDLAMLAELLFTGRQLVGVPDVAYRYRRHGANESAKLTAEATRFAEEAELHRLVAARATALGWRRTARMAALMPTVRLHAAYRAAGDAARGHPGAAAAKLRALRRRPR